MDDDALHTSEYYREIQSIRALRKRKWKNDSAAGSGESWSKNKSVELLDSILYAVLCSKRRSLFGGEVRLLSKGCRKVDEKNLSASRAYCHVICLGVLYSNFCFPFIL